MSRRKDKAQRFLSTFVAVLGDSGEEKQQLEVEIRSRTCQERVSLGEEMCPGRGLSARTGLCTELPLSNPNLSIIYFLSLLFFYFLAASPSSLPGLLCGNCCSQILVLSVRFKGEEGMK